MFAKASNIDPCDKNFIDKLILLTTIKSFIAYML